MEQPPVDPLKSGLASGCPRAYAELYDRLGPALLRTARTVLRSSAEAEDAVQDVFVAIVRSRHRLANVDDLASYVFAALHHAISRRLASRAAERRKLEELSRITPVESPGPAQRDDRLEGALASLPDEQREVVALKIDGDLTFAQIADVLGVSINTAASRYRYAMEKLRRMLGEES